MAGRDGEPALDAGTTRGLARLRGWLADAALVGSALGLALTLILVGA